jgi:hypothetical protein
MEGVPGVAFNEMVVQGELKVPIVIERDHLDSPPGITPHTHGPPYAYPQDPAVEPVPVQPGLR